MNVALRQKRLFAPQSLPSRQTRLPRPLTTTIRDGLTLLEVVVSLAIFLFSFAVIVQLLSLSSDRAQEINLRSQGNMLAQSKLAEVVAGCQPMQTVDWAASENSPDWQWKMDCPEGDVAGLHHVQIHVKRDRANGSTLEICLGQMVFDASKRGSTLGSSASDSADSSSTSSSTSSSATTTSTTSSGAP